MTDTIRRYETALLPTHDADPIASLHALRTVVFELMLEVDALRLTLADAGPELHARYARHYVDVHLCAYNTAGVRESRAKSIDAFVGERPDREDHMLQRLGLDPAEFHERARSLSMLT